MHHFDLKKKKQFIHSMKTLQCLLFLMSENKYWVHIFLISLFSLRAQRVRESI